MKTKSYHCAKALLMLAPTLWLGAQMAAGATRTVNNLHDDGPDSLRQRISESGPGDMIDFSISGTITLTSGELVISRNLSILGPGAHKLTVDANASSRGFNIGNVAVNISGLTVANGLS